MRVYALRGTMQRLCDSGALQRHRGMRALSSTRASRSCTFEALRRTERRRLRLLRLAAAQGQAEAAAALELLSS